MQRYKPDIQTGLSSKQVQTRIQEGLVNVSNLNKTKSYKQILADNIFTLFNFVNMVLAIIIIPTGSFKNLLFLGVAFWNIVIGTFQEIRSKRTLDKISLIVSSKAHVLRDGKRQDIAIEDIVLDDLLFLETGNQITSDSILIEGSLEVDESLLTGESDVVKKQVGDMLYSGSFVVSGSATTQVEQVGDDNYAAKITSDAKKFNRYPSQLRDSLNKIIKIIGIIIIPLGIAMFIQGYFFIGSDYSTTVLKLSAALIGMIPEGLIILTSIALAVGAVNLAKHKTLVQELYCLETLARVDTLCLDKTGTITEGKMEVKDTHQFKDVNLDEILGNYLSHANDNNATFDALNVAYKKQNTFTFIHNTPFSSKRKYGLVAFENATYALGAYEYLVKEKVDEVKLLDEYSAQGYRVLTLCKSNTIIKDDELPKDLEVLAFILLVDKIRESAFETLSYFDEQGVDLKVISGDNPITVSEVSRRAGLKNADAYIDVSKLDDEALKEAVIKYSVFGRVSPAQKKLMVQCLREEGHTVAMTGDGVNDVLAFKEANISIAMASGSDVARSSANLVLLDNNFDALPFVLYEGRRVINNIEKVATLFLTKTIFSMILAFMVLFLRMTYLFVPIQLTFVSALTIGIPAFVIALEPNRNRVKGKFLENVLKVSLPAALSVIVALIYCLVMKRVDGLSSSSVEQLALITISINGLIVLSKVARPFTTLRLILYALMSSGVVIGLLFFHNFLNIEAIHFGALYYHIIVIAGILIGVSYALALFVQYLYRHNVKKQQSK